MAYETKLNLIEIKKTDRKKNNKYTILYFILVIIILIPFLYYKAYHLSIINEEYEAFRGIGVLNRNST